MQSSPASFLKKEPKHFPVEWSRYKIEHINLDWKQVIFIDETKINFLVLTGYTTSGMIFGVVLKTLSGSLEPGRDL